MGDLDFLGVKLMTHDSNQKKNSIGGKYIYPVKQHKLYSLLHNIIFEVDGNDEIN